MNSAYSQCAGDCTSDATVNHREFSTVRIQKNLFDQPSTWAEGSLDDGALVRSVLIKAIKKSKKSRAQLVEDISRLSGRKLTEIALNKFTAESRSDYRWPAELDRAFCAATGDIKLLICRVELAGLHVINEEEFELLKLGREYLKQKRAAQQVQALESRLQGVEL